VALEDPSYLGAIEAYSVAGARLVSIPVGPDGADVSALRDAVTRGCRLLYLMPTFQNPTGTVMTEPMRREIARIAVESQVPVVEDHVLSDLTLDRAPPPPIAAFAPDAPILTIGSLSKLVWGGLRIGWIRAPEPLVERLARFKAVADLGGPALSQALAARLLVSREAIRRTRRSEMSRKLGALAAGLRAHLPRWSFREPAGGMLLWVRLPEGRAEGVVEVARRHGVGLVAGSVHSPSGRWADHLRLPAIHEPEALEQGLPRLAAAWEEYRTRARDESARPLGVLV
jgi:DNA-binding transcriptional MocR family regulator